MPHSDRLEELVSSHSTALFRAALSVTGSREDAEDAVQEAYLKFLEKCPKLDGQGREKAWLMRVCVNAALDRLREKKRHPTGELLDVYPAPDGETRELLESIGRLPAPERAAIHLFYYEGYSTDEIAKILRCRPGTARSTLSRARERLRRELKGELAL